jgi:N utilization substance protein B
MISRRNIRVKVMQSLYTLQSTGNDFTEKQIIIAQNNLNDSLRHSLDLFLTMVHYVNAVALFAEKDARIRASKYLPTDADKNVNTKISGNTFIWQTLENETFKEKIKSSNIDEKIDYDWVKKIYQELCKSEKYQTYIIESSRNPKDEKSIIRFVWTELMIKNESFQEFLNDELSGWEDDKDMIFILMDNYFKNNHDINFLTLLSGDKKEYAHSLLRTAIDKQDYCDTLIEPKLINWEAERVAQIDLILLRLGICELLYFETIPTKVTINEYIEVAKQYSTPQSGQFINAILDNILKDLEKENKIHKSERRK